jgi:hypothetical protein
MSEAIAEGAPSMAWASMWVGVRNDAAVTALSIDHWMAPFGAPFHDLAQLEITQG